MRVKVTITATENGEARVMPRVLKLREATIAARDATLREEGEGGWK